MKKYISRNIEKNLLKLSKGFPVILVTGARQVGKSTLLNEILIKQLKNINYVTLDNFAARSLALEDPELFLETYPAPLIIDEFQYAPNLLSYIKIIVDKKRLEEFNNNVNSNSLYFLTGSQLFLSMKEVSDSLAGRIGIINLYGLSSREIMGKKEKLFIPNINNLKKEKIEKQTINNIFERIFKGSYPELYVNANMPIKTYYESYVKTYIERDIRDLIKIKDEVKFVKFLISLAARTAQELNLSEIARDAEISVPTSDEWLSILVNTGIVYLLEPFSKNVIKRVVKRPKIYFMDTGLASYLTRYETAEILEASSYSGAIFETYVITEIIKSFNNNGLNPKEYLYYYRDNLDNEIDLIIDYQDKIYPMEIKKNKNPNKNSIKNFEVLKNINLNVEKGIVLCMSNEIFPLDKDNYLVPIEYI